MGSSLAGAGRLDPELTRLPGPHTPSWGISFPICEMGPWFLISGLYSVLCGAMAHLRRGWACQAGRTPAVTETMPQGQTWGFPSQTGVGGLGRSFC